MPTPLLSRNPSAAIGRGLVDLRDWQLYRDVERLHPLGPRIVYEVLAGLGASTLSRTEIERIIRRFIIALCPPQARR